MKTEPKDRKSGPYVVSTTIDAWQGSPYEIRVQVNPNTGHARWNCPQLGKAFTGTVVGYPFREYFKPDSIADATLIKSKYRRLRGTTCKNGTYWSWK